MSEPKDERDPLIEILRQNQREASERIEQHKAVRDSEPYRAQRERLNHVTASFLYTLRVSAFAATRAASLPEDSFFLRNMDDLSQSAVMAMHAFHEGGLNSGRRELRFMLELSVQSQFVDESMARSPFDHRLVFFEKKTKNTSVDHVKDLQLPMLGKDEKKEYVEDMVRTWSKASRYVHPTPQQIREKLDMRDKGIVPGCETAEQLEVCVDELFHAESLVVVLVFHAIGASFTGDILVDCLDGIDEWPFHASRHMAAIDQFFDYKQERQATLEAIRARREKRLQE